MSHGVVSDRHDHLGSQNDALKAQIKAARQELAEARKAHSRLKKAASDDLSDLSKIDKQIAKLRKQNAEMRSQLDQTNRVDDMKALRSEVADLQQQLEAQELENETLQKLLDRQRQGVAQQGPTEGQQKEATRLKQQVRALQRQLREEGKASVQGGRQQQQQHLEYAKLCERRSRLKRSLEEGEVALQRIKPAVESVDVAKRLEESEKTLKGIKQQRKLQKKKYDVRVHDLKSELDKLRTSLEHHTTSIMRKREAMVEAYEALGLEPPESVDANEAELLAEIGRAQDEEARRERMQAKAHVRAEQAADTSPPANVKRSAAEARRQQKKAATLLQAHQRGRTARLEVATRRAERLAEIGRSKKSAVNPFGIGGGKKKKGLFGGGISMTSAQPAAAASAASTLSVRDAKPISASPFASKAPISKPAISDEPPSSWKVAPPASVNPPATPQSAVETPRVLGEEGGSISAASPPQLTSVVLSAADAPAPSALAQPALAVGQPKMGRRRRMLDNSDDTPVLSSGASYAPPLLAPVVPPASAPRRTPSAARPGPVMDEAPNGERQAGVGFGGGGTISSALAAAREEMASGGSHRDKALGFGGAGSLGGALAAAREEMAGGGGAFFGTGTRPMGLGRRAGAGGPMLGKPVLGGVPASTGPRNDLELDFGTGPTRQPIADPFANVQSRIPAPASDPFARKPLGSKPADTPINPSGALPDPFAKPPLAKPPPKLLSPSKLTAPNFTDEIDDEQLAAEEQAFLARMKGGGGNMAPADTTVAEHPPSAAARAAAPILGKEEPASVQMRASFVDDVADVSDEELL